MPDVLCGVKAPPLQGAESGFGAEPTYFVRGGEDWNLILSEEGYPGAPSSAAGPVGQTLSVKSEGAPRREAQERVPAPSTALPWRGQRWDPGHRSPASKPPSSEPLQQSEREPCTTAQVHGAAGHQNAYSQELRNNA